MLAVRLVQDLVSEPFKVLTSFVAASARSKSSSNSIARRRALGARTPSNRPIMNRFSLPDSSSSTAAY